MVSPPGRMKRKESPCPTSNAYKLMPPPVSSFPGLSIHDAETGMTTARIKSRINIFLCLFRMSKFKSSLPARLISNPHDFTNGCDEVIIVCMLIQ